MILLEVIIVEVVVFSEINETLEHRLHLSVDHLLLEDGAVEIVDISLRVLDDLLVQSEDLCLGEGKWHRQLRRYRRVTPHLRW